MQTAQTPQAAKWGHWKLLGLVPLLLLAGCQSGAGTGALAGAGAGALAGNLLSKGGHGNKTAGTVVGGAIGAIGGAIIGDSVEASQKRKAAEANARATAIANAQRAPSVDDIIAESTGGVSEAIMINQIRTTHASYQLTPVEVQRLNASGVPQSVISEMLTSAQPRAVYVPGQPRVYERVIVEEPAPVSGVAIGATFGGRR
jgi:hypothetical protein